MPHRILLVEDGESARTILSMLLRVRGYQVRAEADGPAAVAAAEAFQPEVVLLDIGLPGMSGLEVCRRLRDLKGTCGAVFVALSGRNDEKDFEKSIEAGFDHHVPKPVDIGELEKLFRKRRTTGAQPALR
jgi:CheY-like chemotaxis protein